MAQHLQDRTTLQGGVSMPWVGLGVFQVEDGDGLVQAVKSAVAHGYRSIDTAAVYANERGVGQAVKEAMAENKLAREELFITSKVWNADLGYEETLAAYDASLEKLGLEYLDLYLIHWPVKGKYKASWRALETLYRAGRVKAIGVSNFQIHHLEDILQDAEVRPMVNQVELHPYLSQQPLRSFAQAQGIQIEAWAPLMQGWPAPGSAGAAGDRRQPWQVRSPGDSALGSAARHCDHPEIDEGAAYHRECLPV